MMNEEFVEALLSAPDTKARQVLVEQHPEHLQVDFVRGLKDRADRIKQDDARQALAIGRVAEDVAEATGSDEARALAAWIQASAHNFLAENEDAVRCYHRAAELFKSAGKPLDAARTGIGEMFPLMSLGRFDETQAVAEGARTIFIEAGDVASQAKIDMNLGNLHYQQGRFAIALEDYRRATEAFASIGDNLYGAMNQVNQASALTELDDFLAAEQLHRQARPVFEAAGLRTAAASVDHDLAFLQYSRGDYTEAFRTYERARDIFTDLSSQDNIAQTDLAESDLYLDLNMPDAALRLAERAEQSFDNLSMPLEMARARTNRSIALARLGDPDQAAQLLDTAHELFAAQGSQAWTAHTDLRRAEVLRQAGQHVQARALASRASKAYAKLGTKTKESYAFILSANSWADTQDWDRALEDLLAAQQALAGLAAPWLEQRIETCRGRVCEGKGDPAGAIEHYRKATSLIEKMTAALTADEQRTAFIADKLTPYEALVALHGYDNASAAFQWAEQAKSRALVDFLAAGIRPRLHKGDENDLRRAERLHALREELNWHYSRLTRGTTSINSDAPAAEPQNWARVQELEREITSLWRDLQARHAEELSVIRSQPISTEELQASLPGSSALVEFYIARGQVTSFLLTREKVVCRPAFAALGDLLPLLEKLALQFSKVQYGTEYYARHRIQLLQTTQEILAQLGQMLLGPLWEELAGADVLYIVPHGSLHALPFHALRMADRYLVETHTISYAPSAAIFRYCFNKTMPEGKSVPFAGRPLLVGVPGDQVPQVTKEIQSLAALLPEPEILLGEQAGFKQFTQAAPDCGLLHLAAHGMFRPDAPLLSSIQLADRWLAVQDVYDLDLSRTALVALSACETGLGKDAGGDDLVGLVRGFLYAGASSLIVNLWMVEDESMTRLMIEFYGHWLAGAPKAKALREAQLALLALFEHPFFWAPLILVGQPR